MYTRTENDNPPVQSQGAYTGESLADIGTNREVEKLLKAFVRQNKK
jgi:hypothetical protein